MTTTLWKNMIEELPADAATVWVRMDAFSLIPTQATWDLATATFTTIGTAMIMPWWVVSRWRTL